MCKIPEEKAQKSSCKLACRRIFDPNIRDKSKKRTDSVLEGSVYWIIEKTAGHYATAVFWENVFL